MYQFLFLFLLFIIYSFFGWVMEIISIRIADKKFTNRGFLIGPYCPIYGTGAITIILLNTYFEINVFVLFLLIAICVSIIEYITSYVMEKLFKARWWDYSDRFLNIHGRVCIRNSVLFGILGIIFAYYIHPVFIIYLDQAYDIPLMIISSFILILFIIDLVVSFKVIKKIQITAVNLKRDNTEEITEKIKELLMTNSLLTKRLIKAFPNLKAISDIIKNNK